MSRLVDYESFKQNPFTLEKDKQYFGKITESKGHYVDRHTGEVIDGGHKFKEVDHKPFIKMFNEALPVIQGLKSKAQRVLYEILMDLKKGEDEVYLNASSLADKHGLSNSRDILLGIKELLDNDIICRKADKDMYFVNVRYIFNGDRVKYSQGLKREK